MKALVISGGGCMGAFAGGVAEYLITEKHRDYRLFVGSSTGALLLPPTLAQASACAFYP